MCVCVCVLNRKKQIQGTEHDNKLYDGSKGKNGKLMCPISVCLCLVVVVVVYKVEENERKWGGESRNQGPSSGNCERRKLGKKRRQDAVEKSSNDQVEAYHSE